MNNLKLYTEEQLKEAFNCGRLYQGRQDDTNIYHLIDKLTPIELPSDEEVTMTDNKQQTAVDSIIELCQKQMDTEIHLKTTLLMMTNKTQQTAVKLLRLKEQLDSNPWQYNWIIEEIDEIIDALNNEEDDDDEQQ